MKNAPPISFDQVPPEWWHVVREVIVREGRASRGNPVTRSIEVKSLSDNTWGRIMMPGNALEFVDDESLAKAERMIQGVDPLPVLPEKKE